MLTASRASILAGLAWAPLIAGCSPLTEAVPVTALNYTGRELDGYVFADIEDPQKVAGGPGANPFRDAGTTCCMTLPKTWRPGIKVTLKYDFLTKDGRELPRKIVVLEVPKYPTGRPGMLWALLYPDGSAEAVASAVTPAHALWPGKVKGWPVPSRAYLRSVWARDRSQLAELRQMTKHRIQGGTDEEYKESWKHFSERSPREISSFKGPYDPRFREFVKSWFQSGVNMLSTQINELDRTRP